MQNKYKIAIITDSSRIEKWKYKIIIDLQSSGIAEIKIFIKETISKNSCGFLYKLYEKLDRRVFSATRAFKDLSDEENAFELIDISSLKEIDRYFIDDSFISLVVQDNKIPFDFVLNLTQEKFPENFIDTKYGQWSFSFGNNQGFLKAPFLTELLNNEYILKCSLNAIVNDDELELYSSYTSINPFSLYLNQNKNYWKASNFVLRSLQALKESKAKIIDKKNNKQKEYPSNFYMLLLGFKLGKRVFVQKIQSKFLKGQWFLAFTDKFQNFSVINPPKDRFFADPFLMENKNKTYIFFEDYSYKKNKGVISCMEILQNNEISSPKTILERDYHLSYPFVFKEKDKFYMIPETLGNKTIELYEAQDFPLKWSFNRVLFSNINAVDSTLLKHNNKYWLFTSIAEKAGYLCDELFLFYADSLFGEWTPHRKNPIVSDVRAARCAGKIFIQNGDLIRPSQETSIRYGYQLNFNKIEILSENDYKETLIKKIKPESLRGNLALHTYNLENKVEIIDGYKFIRKFF